MQKQLCLALLLSLGCGSILAQAEKPPISQQERKNNVVFVKPQEVLRQSEEFADRRKQIQDDVGNKLTKVEEKAKNINDEKQKLQSDIQDLQNGSKSKFTSKEARQQKEDELEERNTDLENQEASLKKEYQKLREKSSRQEQELYGEMQEKMMKAAELVGQEQGWGAVDVASLYVAPSLDITDDVAQAMNKEYRERKQSKQQAVKQTEKEAANKTAEQTANGKSAPAA